MGPQLLEDAVYVINPEGTAFLEVSPLIEVRSLAETGQERLFLVSSVPKLKRVRLVHDGSRSEVLEEIESPAGRVPFDRWLELRSELRSHSPSPDSGSSLGLKGPEGSAQQGELLAGRYELRGKLGARAVGGVYRVYDRQFGEEVALKLADFGTAQGGSDVRLTRSLEQLGDVANMAPEVVAGGQATYGSDVFSVAGVFHELVTGRPALGMSGEGLDGPFCGLVRRMGALEPGDRPTSAEALAAVTAIQAGLSDAGSLEQDPAVHSQVGASGGPPAYPQRPGPEPDAAPVERGRLWRVLLLWLGVAMAVVWSVGAVYGVVGLGGWLLGAEARSRGHGPG